MDMQKLIGFFEQLKADGKITEYEIRDNGVIDYGFVPDKSEHWGDDNVAWSYSGSVKLEDGKITVGELANLKDKEETMSEQMYAIKYTLTGDLTDVEVIHQEVNSCLDSIIEKSESAANILIVSPQAFREYRSKSMLSPESINSLAEKLLPDELRNTTDKIGKTKEEIGRDDK